MKTTSFVIAPALALTLLAAGCGGESGRDMMGAGPDPGAVLLSVTPPGGASGVPGSTPIVLRFAAAMGAGMEQYVDLHAGGLSGATVPMSCRWSGDRTTLTCTPQGPLAGRTPHVVHVGGGLMTEAGRPVDCDRYGAGQGGRRVMEEWMGPGHGAPPWGGGGPARGGMPPGWRGPDGSYGMAFAFTTA